MPARHINIPLERQTLLRDRHLVIAAALVCVLFLCVLIVAGLAQLSAPGEQAAAAGAEPAGTTGTIDRSDAPGPGGVPEPAGSGQGARAADSSLQDGGVTGMAVIAMTLAGTAAILIAGVALFVRHRQLRISAARSRCARRWPDIPALGALPPVAGRQFGSALAGVIQDPGFARAMQAAGRELQQGGGKALLIASAVAGDGRTTVALNLAAALARTGQRVLLLDADLRGPTLSRILNLPTYDGGLSELVSRTAPYRSCLALSPIPNLHVIRSGSLPEDPAKLLASARFARTVQLSRHYYDHIVIDSPAFNDYRDAEVLTQIADRVLVVVDARIRQLAAIDKTIKLLKRVNAPIAGFLFNRSLA